MFNIRITYLVSQFYDMTNLQPNVRLLEICKGTYISNFEFGDIIVINFSLNLTMGWHVFYKDLLIKPLLIYPVFIYQ